MAMRGRTKAAAPAPSIDVALRTSAHADRADVNVAVMDQPGLLCGIRAAATGESGHVKVARSARQRRAFRRA
jgi:hypothetical protein